MGQDVTVVERASSRPGMVRFETNRPLSGMGHERYASLDDVVGDRPVDDAARLLFETGQVDLVHIYGNMITVELARGATSQGLAEVIEGMFTYYVPGVVPPTDEELIAGL
jgi:hypothetical protein